MGLVFPETQRRLVRYLMFRAVDCEGQSRRVNYSRRGWPVEVGGLCVPLSVMQISVRGEHVGGSPAKILSARGSSEENENAHAPLKCFVLY